MKRSVYFNKFLQATVATLRHFNPEVKVDFRDPARVESVLGDVEYGIGVDFFGDFQGRVLYEMSRSTAVKIAELMNTEVNGAEEIDEKQLLSTIKELGNLITARAAIEFEKTGKTIDISSPFLVDDESEALQKFGADFIRTPLQTSLGEVNVNIGLKTD